MVLLLKEKLISPMLVMSRDCRVVIGKCFRARPTSYLRIKLPLLKNRLWSEPHRRLPLDPGRLTPICWVVVRLLLGWECPATSTLRRVFRLKGVAQAIPRAPQGARRAAGEESSAMKGSQHAPPRADGLVRIAPGGVLVANDTESRYMRHFEDKVNSRDRGMVDWSLWKHLVLQLCHRESFVKESVIAIGALVKSVEMTAAYRALPSDPGALSLAKMHKQFALVKYGKAVHAMQLALGSAKPREVLIACMLVFCFEIILNNRHMALSHATAGHRLLCNWREKTSSGLDINRNGLVSPAPLDVDDELVEAFERLNLQVTTVFDVRPVEVHQRIIHEARNVVQLMPSIFDDMNQARRYLNAVMRRCHHFLATSWSKSNAGALYRKLGALPAEEVVTTGNNIFSTPLTVDDSVREQAPGFMREIASWSRSFEPLFQESRSREKVGTQNYIVGTLLRLHAIATKIVVAGASFTYETSYDVFLPEFREMIALANIIVDSEGLESRKQNPGLCGFMLDLGILAPLFLLCLRCRDGVVRRRGIEILSSWHDESFWTPTLIANMCPFIMEVEEAGMVDGHIPESARAVITAVCEGPTPDDGGPTEVLIQCVQRFGSSDGGPVWHEKLIQYYKVGKSTDFQSG
ncbi:hypothetical protein BP5796_01611 [Coleophoma crateriformis]|uniref:Uncharacterized protein n=1 Tax=Coleophoma crateriformis TaxID=565419 RepID=A0A3D8T0W8_9HELO|nr:hypothetical protein BP5796_01611 [Coleophoma crateriformis]